MREVKGAEINEIKKPESEGFKEITPQHGMNYEQAKEFWNNKFDKMEDVYKKVECINEKLAEKEHPETKVPFEKKIVEVDGVKYEVVVPAFASEHVVQLPKEKLFATDKEQFDFCNQDLKNKVEADSEFRKRFDEIQFEQIMDGETPDGYTWHHDADVGKMQLVDTEIHQKTGHTGGRKIWGGGSEYR